MVASLLGTVTTKAVMVTRLVSLALMGTGEGLLVMCLRDGWKMVQNRGKWPVHGHTYRKPGGGHHHGHSSLRDPNFFDSILRSRETTE